MTLKARDHYAVLGVLPDAEDIVIKAAYRAMAQRYHPDKWTGQADEATRRMAELNEAYAVLADAQRRAEYDKARSKSGQADYAPEDDADEFTSALNEVEDRWQVACSIFPDLADHRKRLNVFASSLAFSYVTIILENKGFEQRAQVADRMERMFMERYFGSNQEVLIYAKYLVIRGQRVAARALNNLVDVMGSNVDGKLLISKIDKEFAVDKLREAEEAAAQRNVELAARTARKKSVAELRHEIGTAFDENEFLVAWRLAQILGMQIYESGFLKVQFSIHDASGQRHVAHSKRQFTEFVAKAADQELGLATGS